MHWLSAACLLLVASSAAASDVLALDYEAYPSQLAEWEQHVQDVVLNGPSASDLEGTTEDLEEDAAMASGHFGDDVGVHDDAEETDPDMHFGEDDMEDDDEEAGLLNNLDITSDADEDHFAAQEQAEAMEFRHLRQLSSQYPTQDYIDLRLADPIGAYATNDAGKPVYSAGTDDETKDAIALIRRMYSPHSVVSAPESSAASDAGVSAEIYLRKHMAASDVGGDAAAAHAVTNIDMGDIMEEASKDWDIIQQHFKSFAHSIQADSRLGVKKLANWSSMVRARIGQTTSRMQQWAKSIKQDAHEKWVYLQRQARKAARTVRGLLVCPKSAAPQVKPSLAKTSGVSKDATAFIVLRAEDAVSDWVHNFHHEKVACNLPGCTGQVHHGFKECYDSLRTPLMAKLTSLIKSHNIKRFVIAGYSLGGAMSVLHALDAMHSLPTVSVGLVTFGQPKVGDSAFAATLNAQLPSYPRVVAKFHKALCNCEMEERADYVTSLPKADLGFVHAGMEVSVACSVGDCDTRCCPQNVINQIKCHSLDRYLHSTWTALSA